MERIRNFYEYCMHGIRYLWFELFFPEGQLEKNITIDARVRIPHASNVLIERASHLQEGVWLNTLASTKGVAIHIGKECDLGRFSFLSAAQSITLGEKVLLAPNVYISDHAHNYRDTNVAIMHQGISKPQPIEIGSGSWIGINTTILPGAKIGKQCVIGANSVVNSVIPPYSVAVGAPARVIKTIRHGKEKRNTKNPKR